MATPFKVVESGYRGLKTHGSQGKTRVAGWSLSSHIGSPHCGLSLGCRGFSTRGSRAQRPWKG